MASFFQIQRFNSFRTVSNFRRHCGTKTNMLKALTNVWADQKTANELKSVQEEVVDYLVGSHHFKPFPEVCETYKKVTEYNVGGNLFGFIITDMYKALANKEDLTSENIKLANLLAWCYEAIVGSIVISDDLIDGSPIRRGKLPWHRLEDVGLKVINHSFLLESCVYLILSKYFRDKNTYNLLLEIYHRISFTVFAGQTFDNTFVKNGKPQLQLYTVDRWKQLGLLKVGYFAFYPLLLATCLTGKHTKEVEMTTKWICQLFSPIIHANNDYNACFDNHSKTEQGDSDISEGKCTWLVIRALEKATPTEKNIIERYYGRPGAEVEFEIRKLYDHLELEKDYKKYERETMKQCFDSVKRLSDEEHRDAWLTVMSKVQRFFDFFNKYSNEKDGNARTTKLSG